MTVLVPLRGSRHESAVAQFYVRRHGALLKMSDWQPTRLRFFNFAGRFVGVGFIIVGGICFLYALSQGDVLAIVMIAIVPVLGILLLCAKPYRPDVRVSNSPESDDSHKKMD